jgi:hypothetical protein
MPSMHHWLPKQPMIAGKALAKGKESEKYMFSKN